MLAFIFFIYKLTTLFLSINSETCPFSITCNNNLLDNLCLIKTKTDSNKVFDINVASCLSNQYKYCNAYDALVSNTTEKTIKCENVPINLTGYPGDICEVNKECLFGFCLNELCTNSFENFCDSHENCPIGTACILQKCSPYKNINEECHDSYECSFNAICYHQKCVKKYSFENGVELNDNYLSQGHELCKSGDFYYHKNKYVCGSLRNVHDSCREDCEYYNENNEVIVLEERCVCGYNKERSKHCVLGSGEQVYIDFINTRQKLLNNEDYTKYCHTLERDSYDICIKAQRVNRTVAFRTFIQNYTNHKILALEHAKVNSSEECVKNVIFGYNNDLIVPDIQQCPKVTCDRNLNTCLYGENPLNEDGTEIFVKVNDKICSDKEICYIDNTKQSIMPIFSHQKVEGQCKPSTKAKRLRYPGEDCSDNDPCISPFKCSENNKCSGKNLEENCTDTSECLAGLYCYHDDKTHQCRKQVELGGACSSSWDCVNYLGCYKNRCIKYGNLASGVSLTSEDVKFEGEESNKAFLCELGRLSYDSNRCATIDYAGETLQKLEKGEDFVKCNKEDYCWYSDGENIHKQKCQCGYNKDGQGYCTLPNKYKQNNWRERVQIYGELSNNKCHSKSRFDCYLIPDEEIIKKKRRASILTFEANLFHGADECLYKIFANGNIIKTYSFLGYGAVLVFLFL